MSTSARVLLVIVVIATAGLGCATSKKQTRKPSLVKSSASTSKNDAIVIDYNPQKDWIRLKVKDQPFYKVIEAFARFTSIEVHYNREELQKRVSLETPFLPVLKALRHIVEQSGFQLERAQVGIGFVVRPPWGVPSWGEKELSERIRFAKSPEELGDLLYLNNPKYYQPYVGRGKERQLTADIYYAYRPIFQDLLWKHVPLLKEKRYFLPKKLLRPENLRAYYHPGRQEILTEVLFLALYPHTIHIVFHFSFTTLSLRRITLFVTATRKPR